jgi:hypothetical protein
VELLQRYYTSLIKSHGGFTQAPEPIDSPLKSLPTPKPTPDPITSNDPLPEQREPDEHVKSSSQNQDTTTQPVDIPISPKNVVSTINTGSAPETSHIHHSAGLGSGTNSAPDSGRMEIDDPDDPVSPASSSIPSSSRSSLRTRNVSMTQLDPSSGITAASPRIDMTTASGRVVMQVDDDESSKSDSIPQDQEGKTGHTHGAGGKLLKSMIGGIFKRRDSAHHSDPPPPPPPPPQNSNRLIPPHQSPGRRVKSPLMTSFPNPQGEVPAMAAAVTPRVRNREETNGC